MNSDIRLLLRLAACCLLLAAFKKQVPKSKRLLQLFHHHCGSLLIRGPCLGDHNIPCPRIGSFFGRAPSLLDVFFPDIHSSRISDKLLAQCCKSSFGV